jgi:ribulose-phosphate 3-epimerase
MVKIAPSILSADFATLGQEVRRVEKAGADWVHVDVMDGLFVPNITIGPGVVRSIRPHTKLPLDVHLMIMRPENFIEIFASAGADLITIHLEASDRVEETLLRIRSLGKLAGISINPATSFEKVRPFMKQVDLLLIMTVNPGFGGQAFIPECLEKIRQAREFVDRHGLEMEIEVDGGINAQTGRSAAQAGASVLAAGNALFGAKDMAEEIAGWKRF